MSVVEDFTKGTGIKVPPNRAKALIRWLEIYTDKTWAYARKEAVAICHDAALRLADEYAEHPVEMRIARLMVMNRVLIALEQMELVDDGAGGK